MKRGPACPGECDDGSSMTLYIAIGYCRDCRDIVGPDHAEDVGAEIAIGDHEGHDTHIVDSWEEEFEPSGESSDYVQGVL